MAADGRIGLPLAPDATAHQDFELTIDGAGPNTTAGRPEPSPAPADLRTAVI